MKVSDKLISEYTFFKLPPASALSETVSRLIRQQVPNVIRFRHHRLHLGAGVGRYETMRRKSDSRFDVVSNFVDHPPSIEDTIEGDELVHLPKEGGEPRTRILTQAPRW